MSSLSEFKYASKDVKVEAYRQDGKTITKAADSNVYTVRQGFSGKRAGEKASEDDAAFKQGFEGLFDAYIGNRSNNFNAETKDGATVVTIKLDENEISPLDNAIVSFALRIAGAKGFEGRKNNSIDDLKAIVPQLSSDITVKAVDATAVIKNNSFESQDAKITVTGKDANGAEHTVVINAAVNL